MLKAIQWQSEGIVPSLKENLKAFVQKLLNHLIILNKQLMTSRGTKHVDGITICK